MNPIISRELWDTVQRELKKRDRKGALGAGHSNRYVFSGKIKRGQCGASFVSRKKTRKDSTLYRRWRCYTATSEGRKHLDIQGNEVGRDIGRAIREELAMDILKQSLYTLRMGQEEVIQNVTDLALEAIQMSEEESRDCSEELEHVVNQIERKKADVLDAFFSKQITAEEMRLINERYDGELDVLRKRLEAARAKESITYETERLREDIYHQVTAIVKGETDSEVFYKNILDHMVVHKDQTVEVYLNLLPQKWTFLLEH